MDNNKCFGEHRLFVPEVIGVEAEGKVIVITVCTACGDVQFTDYQVANPGSSLRLLREEREKTNVPI